jgi:hypothetical protein
MCTASYSSFDNIIDNHFFQLIYRFSKKISQSFETFRFIVCYAVGLKFKFVLDRSISVPYIEHGDVVPLQRGSFCENAKYAIFCNLEVLVK